MSALEQITTSEELIIFNNLVSNKIQSLEQFEALMQEWLDYCSFIKTILQLIINTNHKI